MRLRCIVHWAAAGRRQPLAKLPRDGLTGIGQVAAAHRDASPLPRSVLPLSGHRPRSTTRACALRRLRFSSTQSG
ncbi:hypothetical protein EMIT0158MI4_110091 [Burkholderia ambifaria]